VALHVVRLACQRPQQAGRSLSQWDSVELARQLEADGIVSSISPTTVWRILTSHHLKPWRTHFWMQPPGERDEAFYRQIQELIDLYTRPLSDQEVVLSVDEKTSLQPRPRKPPTRAAGPENIPNRLEPQYRRAGALNLFVAFDTRTGQVIGQTFQRKRHEEFIAFLDHLDQTIPASVTTIHVVLDHGPTHNCRAVQAWLQDHPRFVFHLTPVHCSWMNQVEQWFGTFQKKRMRIADFDSLEDLRDRIDQYLRQWNQQAHPYNWSTKSVAKIMADAPEPQAA
jgi:Integrase core domain.